MEYPRRFPATIEHTPEEEQVIESLKHVMENLWQKGKGIGSSPVFICNLETSRTETLTPRRPASDSFKDRFFHRVLGGIVPQTRTIREVERLRIDTTRGYHVRRPIKFRFEDDPFDRYGKTDQPSSHRYDAPITEDGRFALSGFEESGDSSKFFNHYSHRIQGMDERTWQSPIKVLERDLQPLDQLPQPERVLSVLASDFDDRYSSAAGWGILTRPDGTAEITDSPVAVL